MTATTFYKKWNNKYVDKVEEFSTDLTNVFGDYQILFLENEVIVPIAFNSNRNPKLIVVKIFLGEEK